MTTTEKHLHDLLQRSYQFASRTVGEDRIQHRATRTMRRDALIFCNKIDDMDRQPEGAEPPTAAELFALLEQGQKYVQWAANTYINSNKPRVADEAIKLLDDLDPVLEQLCPGDFA